ncbi:MAG: CHAP domain-containing protein [Deltaproteobacteria bacterium]|nr:MAG: CHAP domain-containing protein [Deltaproteobacteria bacterium]
MYPPDHPYQPTPAGGPDVEAHKRALSRLGRWPWQTFDQTYSNGFAHGTSGNVGDTGVEGFQRQTPELDPTGNLTDKLYSHLLRALVPPCLPHAGEYAYDGYALWLLDEANKRQPATATREQALETARSQVGYAETGDNDTKYGRWYGVNYQPWCAIFATWCYETGTQTGSPSFQKGSYYAYVPYIVSDAHNRLRGLSVTSSPAPGDLVCYDWGWDGVYDHVGLFESGGPSSWQAIEGNTSSDNSGSQSNGGGVYRRSRSKSQASVVFVRVAEP